VGLPVPQNVPPTLAHHHLRQVRPDTIPVTAGIRLQRERHPVGMMHVKRVQTLINCNP